MCLLVHTYLCVSRRVRVCFQKGRDGLHVGVFVCHNDGNSGYLQQRVLQIILLCVHGWISEQTQLCVGLSADLKCHFFSQLMLIMFIYGVSHPSFCA